MDALRQQIAARVQQRSRDHTHRGRAVPGLYVLRLTQLYQHLRRGVEHLSNKEEETATTVVTLFVEFYGGGGVLPEPAFYVFCVHVDRSTVNTLVQSSQVCAVNRVGNRVISITIFLRRGRDDRCSELFFQPCTLK